MLIYRLHIAKQTHALSALTLLTKTPLPVKSTESKYIKIYKWTRTPEREKRKTGTCIRESAEIHYTDTDCVSFQAIHFCIYLYIHLARSQKREGEKWRTLSGLSYIYTYVVGCWECTASVYSWRRAHFYLFISLFARRLAVFTNSLA